MSYPGIGFNSDSIIFNMRRLLTPAFCGSCLLGIVTWLKEKYFDGSTMALFGHTIEFGVQNKINLPSFKWSV